MAMAVGIGTFPTPAFEFEIEGKRRWSIIAQRALEPESIIDESPWRPNRPDTVWYVGWKDTAAMASVTPCPGPVVGIVCKIRITDSRLFFGTDRKVYLKDHISKEYDEVGLTEEEKMAVAQIFEARLQQAAQAAPKTFPLCPVVNLEHGTRIVKRSFRAPWQLEEVESTPEYHWWYVVADVKAPPTYDIIKVIPESPWPWLTLEFSLYVHPDHLVLADAWYSLLTVGMDTVCYPLTGAEHTKVLSYVRRLLVQGNV